jgi:hypothetical protein
MHRTDDGNFIDDAGQVRKLTSSGLGGRPVKSIVTRRNSVSGPASGESARRRDSSAAIRN